MIYLDNNATTPLLHNVKAKMLDFINNNQPFNASAIHDFGRKAKNIIENARSQIVAKVALDNYKLIFTPSATLANNIIINSFQNIVVGATEHSSILKEQKNIISVNDQGQINEDHLIQLIKNIDKPFLVSIAHANNETGVLQNVTKLADIVHKYGGVIHSDATQSLGKIILNLDVLSADYYTIASHKIGGPLGCGAIIYKNKSVISPFLKGGGQEMGIFAGTENLLSIIGFNEAVNLLDTTKYINHTLPIRDFIENEAEKNSGVVVAKNSSRLPNTIMLAKKGLSNKSQLIALEMKGFCVSIGSACSSGTVKESPVLQAMNCDKDVIKSCIRISLGLQNNLDEAKMFIKAWCEI